MEVVYERAVVFRVRCEIGVLYYDRLFYASLNLEFPCELKQLLIKIQIHSFKPLSTFSQDGVL